MRFSGSVEVSNFLVWVTKACGDWRYSSAEFWLRTWME